VHRIGHRLDSVPALGFTIEELDSIHQACPLVPSFELARTVPLQSRQVSEDVPDGTYFDGDAWCVLGRLVVCIGRFLSPKTEYALYFRVRLMS